MNGGILNNTVFWVDVEKIKPNPYQPRKEFNEDSLKDLALSIRQYGVLQPLVVTRKEFTREDGGLYTEYELISGERRLRASKIAGVGQVPVIIRSEEQTDQLKLELAIIENLQREDLNPIDRAKAFDQLAKEFQYTHTVIAQKIGKSREYVSNSIRMLSLPGEMIQAVLDGKMSEGHTRPLLMLSSRPEEQQTLFKEILIKRLTVRDAENISRRIAVDRARKQPLDAELQRMEQLLSEQLGTRVSIEKKEQGGKLVINFFSPTDLRAIMEKVAQGQKAPEQPLSPEEEKIRMNDLPEQEDSELYSVTNFTV